MNAHEDYNMPDIENASNKHKRHGMHGTRIYRIWCSMKGRCLCPGQSVYKYYGGKGITVCDEWMSSFMNFYQWAIKNGYSDALTIDRIDNSKGYSPDNCKWSTMKEQERNRSYAKLITYNGKTQCVTAWAEELGISRGTVYKKISEGETGEEALKFALTVRKYGRKVAYAMTQKVVMAIAILTVVAMTALNIFIPEPVLEPDSVHPMANANVSWLESFHSGGFEQ